MTKKRSVSIEKEGEVYTGTYTVSRDLISVEYDFKRKSTQVGGSDVASLARLLLSELVEGL